MRAQFRPDPARGDGYGIIDILDFAGHDAKDAAIRFSLRRALDGKYLTSSGGDWMEAEIRLEPDMAQYPGDGVLRLLVGPSVVDRLDALNTFRITVYPAEGEGVYCGLEISVLIPTSLSGGQGIAASAPLSLSPMPEMRLEDAPPPDSRKTASPPETELALENSVLAGAGEPPTPGIALQTENATAAAPQSDPDPRLPELKDPVERSGKAPLVILLILLACAAAGGGYWWKFMRVPESAPAANAATPAAQTAAPPAGEAPANGGAVRGQIEKLPPLQRAREALRAGMTPEQALQLAKSLRPDNASGAPGDPERADGAFLLLEDAAQKGNPEAMLELARFYDPADTAVKGSIQPDPNQAFTWYSAAEDRGQAAANGKIQALRAWAELEKDNPAARTLLERWK